MRPAFVWSSLVCLGILAGYAGAVRWRSTAVPAGAAAEAVPVRAAPARPLEESQELRHRVAALELELAALRSRFAEAENARNAAPAAPAQANDVEAEAPTPELIARQEHEWHEHMAEVEATYQTEARDPRWARETHDVIDTALSKLPAIARNVQSLECRSETCRLEIVDDGDPNFAKQLPTLQHGLNGKLPTIQYDYARQPDGSQTTILYLSRLADTPELQAPHG